MSQSTALASFARRMAGNFLLALILAALLALLEPVLQMSWYSARLARLPAPASLRPPVDPVRAGALRDSWQAHRPGGRRHEGIDIFAPRGTPVRATTQGVVIRVGRNQLGGRVVWVLGPGGQRHYYAHLARFADIYRGQRIEPGTLLGHVGNTGNAQGTQPHLHYGIYTRQGPINPYPLLARSPKARRAGAARPPRQSRCT